MKTLTILFESPNVFKILPEWPERSKYFNERGFIHDHITPHDAFDKACEQSKANAIRIENLDLLPIRFILNIGYIFTGPNYPVISTSKIKDGSIFQVEGFEYRKTWQWRRFNNDEWKNTNAYYAIDCQISGCETREVAILKLAKEEEPKEQPDEALEGLYRHAYNEAIDDVLKLYANSPKGLIIRVNEIEKLKKKY